MSDKKTKKHQFKGERTRSTLIIAGSLAVYLLTLHLGINIAATAITAVVCAMGAYELIKAIGAESKLLFFVTSAFSVFYTFLIGLGIGYQKYIGLILSLYAVLLLSLAVANNKKIKYTDSVTAFFASVAIPYSLSCFLRFNNIQNYFDGTTHLEGLYFVWLSFSCSWLTDAFAFLVGRKIGKHKMTPVISPKKSFEGAIFGTLITAAINVLILLGYTLVAEKAFGYDSFLYASAAKHLIIVPVSVVLSVVSMFGDLAASLLKRNVGIKDYSNLLPGHGGILDRFDSCLFVLPVLWGIIVLIYS